MQNVGESTSTTDYKYYPIKYPNKLFTTTPSESTIKYAIHGCWVNKVDKEKFLCGICYDYTVAPDAFLDVISIGI